MTYEYVVRSVGVRGPGASRAEAKVNTRIQHELDEMTSQGWRLVSATTAATQLWGSGGTDWLRLICQHEIPSLPASQ